MKFKFWKALTRDWWLCYDHDNDNDNFSGGKNFTHKSFNSVNLNGNKLHWWNLLLLLLLLTLTWNEMKTKQSWIISHKINLFSLKLSIEYMLIYRMSNTWYLLANKDFFRFLRKKIWVVCLFSPKLYNSFFYSFNNHRTAHSSWLYLTLEEHTLAERERHSK